MSKQIAVLVNPAAGGGAAERRVEPVARALRADGAEVTIVRSDGPDDARARAAELVTTVPDALVALGGDGTVHFVAQAVAGTDVPLGIVPVGSGNDIARAFGIPRSDPARAAEVVLAGHTSRIDAVRCGDAAGAAERWFLSVACCGFASKVNERANSSAGKQGTVSYLRAVIGELRAFRPMSFDLELDGESWQTEAMLVAVGNTQAFGGGMRVCPDAHPDDGLLDVMVVGPVSRPEFLRVFPRVYRGTHVSHPAVEVRRASVVTLRVAGDREDAAYADGERLSALPVTATVEPRAVTLLVP